MKKMMMLLLLLLSSALLTGCARWIVKPVRINPALLQSLPAPEIPPAPVSNRQNALYGQQCQIALLDCKSKQARVREVQDRISE